MNNKFLGVIITVLLIIIIYQSGYINKLFSKQTINCDSEKAISLGKNIIREKIFPQLFSNVKFSVDEIQFDTIITKNINKDTGAQECSATTNILGNFQINKDSFQDDFTFFNLFLGSNYVVNLNNNKFLISSPVWYTTEITNDGKQYLINLKFDGDRTKSLYSKNNKVNDEEIFKLILPFAEKGNADLQNKMGVMYSNGKGVKQDLNEAFNWYKKSADQNNVWGLYNLAEEYFSGKTVKKDFVKAFELFKKSAEQENPPAQNRLANMYYSGEGIQQDYNQAAYWYEKSANSGFNWAQKNLADMYYDGKGVKKNFDKAFSLYKLSADSGNSYAQTMLGIMYKMGKGTNEDYSKAIEYLEKAAKQNFDSAYLQLGYIYQDDINPKKDLTKAFSYFLKASELHNYKAKFELVQMYIKGEGIEKSFEKAKFLLNQAQQNGYANEVEEIINKYKLNDKLQYKIEIIKFKIENDEESVHKESLIAYLRIKKGELIENNISPEYINLDSNNLPFNDEINQKIINSNIGDVIKPMKYNDYYQVMKILDIK